MRYSFANIPILSTHNFIAYTHKVVVAFVNTMIMRFVTGQFIVPFEIFANVLMYMFLMMPLESRFLKIIPVTDKRTKSVTYFTVGQYSELPHELLLNPAAKENFSRIDSTTLITTLFGFVRTSHSLLFSFLHTNKNSISISHSQISHRLTQFLLAYFTTLVSWLKFSSFLCSLRCELRMSMRLIELLLIILGQMDFL